MFSDKIREGINKLVASYRDQESPTYNVSGIEYFIHPSNPTIPFVQIHVSGMDGSRGYVDEKLMYIFDLKGDSNRLKMPLNGKLVFFSELKKIKYEQ